MKDHLGNTRVVFSEKKNATEYKATLEDDTYSEETQNFNHYPTGGSRSALPLFDHTDAGTTYTYSQLLTGAPNNQVGLAKSFDVNPGDVFDLEVYAKYEAPESTPTNLNSLLSELVSTFSLGAATSPLDGAQAEAAFENIFQGGAPWINSSMWENDPPKAYLNYILFDENFSLVDFGFDQVSTAGEQVGTTPTAHDYLSLHVKVEQKGFLYVYLSNEQPTVTNVYFDDMKIVRYSGVEQVEDYYPFGLTYNSYSRENSVDQKFKFQGQEHIDDLNLGWDSFKWRNHMPDIGRFFNVDPLAEKYVYNSLYAFSENHVTTHIELEGLEKLHFSFKAWKNDFGTRKFTNHSAKGFTASMNIGVDLGKKSVYVERSKNEQVNYNIKDIKSTKMENGYAIRGTYTYETKDIKTKNPNKMSFSIEIVDNKEKGHVRVNTTAVSDNNLNQIVTTVSGDFSPADEFITGAAPAANSAYDEPDTNQVSSTADLEVDLYDNNTLLSIQTSNGQTRTENQKSFSEKRTIKDN